MFCQTVQRMSFPKCLFAAFVIAMGLTTLCAPTSAYAATGPYIRVEQDWELVIATPDPTTTSPQIYIQMDPYPNSAKGGLFLLNYQDSPSFVAGGLQLQLWNLDQNVALQSFRDGVQLNTVGETVTWTQFMALSNGTLSFGVSRLRSKTWGNNGASDNWSVSSPYTEISTFTGNYQTTDTLSESGILFGASAVTSIKLLQVRKYDSAGKHDDETTTKQLYP